MSKDSIKSPSTLSPSFVTKVSDVAQEFGYVGVTFSGGEPFMRDDLIDYVEALNGRPITIITNGSFLTEQKVREFSQAGLTEIHVNIPAASPALYQCLTGQTSHSLGEILNVVAAAKQNGIRVKINYVLNSFNTSPDQLFRMIDICLTYGIPALRFIEMHPASLQGSDPHEISVRSDLVPSILPPERVFIGERKRRVQLYRVGEQFIEYLKCSCGLSCSHCLSHSDLFLTSDAGLKPCMQDDYQAPALDDIKGAIDASIEFIQRKALKYQT